MEPDPVTRHLVGLYLTPLDYTLQWITSWEEWSPGDGIIAFLLSANALPTPNLGAIQAVAKRLGRVPLVGMAGDRRPFPAEAVPRPIRRVLRKPLRAEDLLAALEALQMPEPDAKKPESPLDGFAAMIEELGMDAAMAEELCHSFIERGEQYLLEAKAAMDPRDNLKLERIAHAFKGMAGNMRFRRVTELADQLLRAARQQQGDLNALTRSLQVEFGAVRRLLQTEWLKKGPDAPDA